MTRWEYQMPEARYYVVRDPEGWIVKFEDEHYGPYSKYDDAERLAVEAARKLCSHGERAHVCIMGDDGKFHPTRTYGRGDPKAA
jgi:hypothetical protein